MLLVLAAAVSFIYVCIWRNWISTSIRQHNAVSQQEKSSVGHPIFAERRSFVAMPKRRIQYNKSVYCRRRCLRKEKIIIQHRIAFIKSECVYFMLVWPYTHQYNVIRTDIFILHSFARYFFSIIPGDRPNFFPRARARLQRVYIYLVRPCIVRRGNRIQSII